MTYCSVVTVLALDGSAKKRSGHYAILKILSLRSPRNAFIPSLSCISLNIETYSFFITGGLYDEDKSFIFRKFAHVVTSCCV